jgi:flagellar motor switch protein FliM
MLNQDEIDALLSGKLDIEDPGGGIQETPTPLAEEAGSSAKQKTVRAYNFWSPDRFSQEQMRAIAIMHEDLAERLSTSLPPFLRANLKPRLVHTEQGRLHDMMEELPRVVHTEQGRLHDLMMGQDPSQLFHMISMSPLPGVLIMSITPNINNIILELRLGGKPKSVHKHESLTKIDQMLLADFAEIVIKDIKPVWGKLVDVEPELDDSTGNTYWIQMTMGNDRVLLVSIELRLHEETGAMNIYIPFKMLKPIAARLRPQALLSVKGDRSQDAMEQRDSIERLSKVNLPVRLFLGSATLSLGELAGLSRGDVIPLERFVDEQLPVQIVNRTRFLAQAGRMGKRIIAQITSIIES